MTVPLLSPAVVTVCQKLNMCDILSVQPLSWSQTMRIENYMMMCIKRTEIFPLRSVLGNENTLKLCRFNGLDFKILTCELYFVLAFVTNC